MNERSLFNAAADIADAAERARYLERACAGDTALRRHIEELLGEQGQLGSFLIRPPDIAGETVQHTSSSEAVGAIIAGRYKLLEPIGEGGMGEVWVADQLEPIRRRVAIKVIKAGMDSRSVLARFEAERQALALMDHPNISRVLDAGTTEIGRPYFVLELVKGIPITEFCDVRKLSARERLELFIPVCQAIQHAHQKGIIHRDIKPSNVLVALHDEKPVPKVIDFGVAKAIGQQLTDKTLYTGFGSLIGTPAYMAPEQATFNQLDVDTRADVYALGVMLYELLAGSPPFEPERLKQVAIDEILRLVREEEPPKPSSRLSTSKTRATIASVRQSDPDKLTRLVRGELDWIVMKCLEKDRARRYETANGLAMDLQRYLRDEPVLACPPSPLYRLRKLARRNKRTVVAAGLILLALVAGIVGTTWGMIGANRAKVVAEDEAGQRQIALDEKGKALEALVVSDRAKSEQLFEALVAQARANRLSGRSGQRFESLAIIDRATQLARTLNLPPPRFLELRNAAIAALALPDLYMSGSKVNCPPDIYGFDFDEAHRIVAMTDRKGACSIRRVADGEEIHRLPPGETAGACRLSRDGRFVAVLRNGSKQPEHLAIEVWKLDEPAPRRLLTEQPGHFVDFDRQTTRIAIGYYDGAIGIFDLLDGRRLHSLPPDTITMPVFVALHPTEPLVAAASYFGGDVVQIRDLRSGKVVASARQGTRPLSLAWHPDGQMLAVGLAEAKLIRLYDKELKGPLRTLESLNAVSSLKFNSAGDRLVTTTWNGLLELFDVETGANLFSTAAWAPTPVLNANGDQLAGTKQDNSIGVWKVGDSREFRTLVRRTAPDWCTYGSVSIHPDGRLLAAALSDGVGFWDLANGRELNFVPLGAANHRVLFEPSGSLLTLTEAGLFRWPVRIDEGHDGAYVVGPPQSLGLPTGSDLSRSRDGNVIATCARTAGTQHRFAGGWIRREDRPGQPIHIDAGADLSSVAVSPDGIWLATRNFGTGAVKVWDARDGKLVKQLVDWGALGVQFSPDGKWLALNLDGGRLFEVGTWTPGPRIQAQVFSVDGEIAAGATTDGRVRLMHVPTDSELATLELATLGQTIATAFSKDGAKLVGTDNRTAKGIHVWDLRLMRQRLASMGLDWDRPAFADAAPSRAGPVSVRILGAADLISWDTWSARASTHFQAREWDKAVAAWSKAIDLLPHDAHTWSSRGAAYSWLGQWDKALEDYTAAIARAPGNSFYWSNRGMAYGRLGKHDKAVDDFTKAIELGPKEMQFWTKRGNAHAALGDWDKAAADFERAITLSPTDAHPGYLLAMARLQVGDRAAFGIVCSSMLERFTDTSDGNAAYWTAWTHTIAPGESVDWKALIRLAGFALDAEPTNFDRMTVFGAALFRAGELDKAAEQLTKAEAAFHRVKDARGTVVYTWLYLALTEQRRGNLAEANQWLRRATNEFEKPTLPKDPAEKTWNRRLTLQLLRTEAETLVQRAELGPPPREVKR